MDEQQELQPQERPRPRRRPRSKMRIFKDTYLPVIIAGLAVILILVFIIGGIVRAVQKSKYNKYLAKQESIAQQQEQERLNSQANALLGEAQRLADSYDYDAAIDLLSSIPNGTEHELVNAKLMEYEAARSNLVLWEDPGQVPNLSFQLLIADPAMALSHHTYSASLNRNFVTVNEFSAILQQLYDNGYVLVSQSDVFCSQADGTSDFAPNSLYLPVGKKPFMLTQTNVNYNLYLIDGDGDGIPDKDGGGIASKLILDQATGKISCEMIDSSGRTVQGAFDLVPILDAFIETHPDFSYKGAKATLALTGYNGLFGYRTDAGSRSSYGEEAYQQAVQQVQAIATALRESGYQLACYTYENIPYGDSSLDRVKQDLGKWQEEVVPILGQMDTLVFAQNQDITADEVYSGEKYAALQNMGFRYYVGFCEGGVPWAYTTADYVRQGRIMVSGSTLAHKAGLFNGMFDPASLLDPSRGEVPQ